MKRTATKQTRPMGMITVTKIVKERIPLLPATDGHYSVGSLIDEHLARMAAQGECVQTVTLDMEIEEWEELATSVYNGYVEEYAA